MVSVLITTLYLLMLIGTLPAVFFIGYNGYKPEKFKNWRLARTALLFMIAVGAGMFFALRTFDTIPDGWSAFVIFSVVLFSFPVGLYADAWMGYDVRNAQRKAEASPIRSEQINLAHR